MVFIKCPVPTEKVVINKKEMALPYLPCKGVPAVLMSRLQQDVAAPLRPAHAQAAKVQAS